MPPSLSSVYGQAGITFLPCVDYLMVSRVPLFTLVVLLWQQLWKDVSIFEGFFFLKEMDVRFGECY